MSESVEKHSSHEELFTPGEKYFLPPRYQETRLPNVEKRFSALVVVRGKVQGWGFLATENILTFIRSQEVLGPSLYGDMKNMRT